MPDHESVADWPPVMVVGLALNAPIETGGALTVSDCPLLVPPAVVTITVCTPRAAFGSIVSVAVSAVPVAATSGRLTSVRTVASARASADPTTMSLTVTPEGLTLTVVAPCTKFPPVTVNVTVVPVMADVALMLVIVGVGGLIVKVCAALAPPAVVTVIWRAPTSAAAAIPTLAVSDVALVTSTALTVTPLPLTVTVVASGTKFVPLSVALTVVPATPTFGLRLASVGAGGTTVNVIGALVPPLAVVSVIACDPSGALPAIASVAVALVAL
jgi:hypothetical protein